MVLHRLLRAACVVLLALAACGGPVRPPPWQAGQPDSASLLPDDPEAAFAALERRLLAAQAIDVAVQVESSDPYPSLLTGTVGLRAGNLLELSIDGKFAGVSVGLRLRSADGRLVGGSHGDGDAAIDQPTPKALDEAIVVGLLGMGVLHNLALLAQSLPPDHADGGAAEWVVTSNHVWDTGRDASVDGRPARALGFDIAVAGEAAGDATLWLDVETGLPVKREQRVRMADATMHVVETYLRFEVSP